MSTPNAESVSQAHTSAQAAHAGEIVLDRYRLVRRIGAGGMGVVYLARDEQLERDVAVKRIAVEHDRDGARRARGARGRAAVAPGDRRAVRVGPRRGRRLPRLRARPRAARSPSCSRDGELSDRDVVRIGVTLCDALEHAHARGVVHRDVKPSNIICPDEPRGRRGVAKLTDFGIARMAGGDVLTRTGDIMGTLAYMAPEQARGPRRHGRRRTSTRSASCSTRACRASTRSAPATPPRPRAASACACRRCERVRRDLPAGLCRAIDAAVRPSPRRAPASARCAPRSRTRPSRRRRAGRRRRERAAARWTPLARCRPLTRDARARRARRAPRPRRERARRAAPACRQPTRRARRRPPARRPDVARAVRAAAARRPAAARLRAARRAPRGAAPPRRSPGSGRSRR